MNISRMIGGAALLGAVMVLGMGCAKEKEAKEGAELGVQLSKESVAAIVKSSVLEKVMEARAKDEDKNRDFDPQNVIALYGDPAVDALIELLRDKKQVGDVRGQILEEFSSSVHAMSGDSKLRVLNALDVFIARDDTTDAARAKAREVKGQLEGAGK